MKRFHRLAIAAALLVLAGTAAVVGCGQREPLGPAAPAPGSIPETVIGTPTPLPYINPAEFYAEALASAESLAVLGLVPVETVDYLVANASTLSTSVAALEQAVTADHFVIGAPLDRLTPLSGGGIVTGPKWEGRSLIGLKVGEGQVEVSWSSTGGNARITGVTHSGGIILGSVWSKQVGSTWIEQCECGGNHAAGELSIHGVRFDDGGTRISGETRVRRTPSAEIGVEPIGETGKICTRECGNYQICWKQKFRFRTLGSGCTNSSTICTPCG